MRKFEVNIKGKNFLVRSRGRVVRNGFAATRCVEAPDISSAVEKAMATLRAELEGAVLNDSSNPPDVSLEDVSEVYYFREDAEKEIKWDEPVDEEEMARPVGAIEKRWLVLKSRVGQRDLHLHDMVVHFTAALYPVSVLFMLIYLVSGYDPFGRTHFYMLLLATLSLPFSYLTGYLDWQQKYEGARIPMFLLKVRYAVVLSALGAAALLLRIVVPGILDQGVVLRSIYVMINLATLPVLVYLGYLGGVILYEGPEDKPEMQAGRKTLRSKGS